MANIIEYDSADPVVTNRVIQYLKSKNRTPYETGDYLINPNLSAVSGVEQKYWKVDTGAVVEMSSGEKDDIDEYLSAIAESSTQESLADIQNTKYWQMIGRLRRRVADGTWSITDQQVEDFIGDILSDNDYLYMNYLHGYDVELIAYINNYNVAAFTTAIKAELVGLL